MRRISLEAQHELSGSADYMAQIGVFANAFAEIKRQGGDLLSWLDKNWSFAEDESKIVIPDDVYILSSPLYRLNDGKNAGYSAKLENLSLIPKMGVQGGLVVQHSRIAAVYCDEAEVFKFCYCNNLNMLPPLMKGREFHFEHCHKLSILPDFVLNDKSGDSGLFIKDCSVEIIPDDIPFKRLHIENTLITSLPLRIQQKIIDGEIIFTGDGHLDPRPSPKRKMTLCEELLGMTIPANYVRELKILMQDLKIDLSEAKSERGIQNKIQTIYPYKHPGFEQSFALNFENPDLPVLIFPAVNIDEESGLQQLPRITLGNLFVESKAMKRVSENVHLRDYWDVDSGAVFLNCNNLESISMRFERDERKTDEENNTVFHFMVINCELLERVPYYLPVETLIIRGCPRLKQLPVLDMRYIKKLEIGSDTGITSLPDHILQAIKDKKIEYKGNQELLESREERRRKLCEDTMKVVFDEVFNTGERRTIKSYLEEFTYSDELNSLLKEDSVLAEAVSQFSVSEASSAELKPDFSLEIAEPEWIQIGRVVTAMQDTLQEMVAIEEQKLLAIREELSAANFFGDNVPQVSFSQAYERLMSSMSMSADGHFGNQLSESLKKQRELFERAANLEEFLKKYFMDLFKQKAENYTDILDILKTVAVETGYAFCSEEVLTLRNILAKDWSDVSKQDVQVIFDIMHIQNAERLNRRELKMFLRALKERLDYQDRLEEIVQLANELHLEKESVGFAVRNLLIGGAVAVTPMKNVFAAAGIIRNIITKLMEKKDTKAENQEGEIADILADIKK